jgi:AraC-like DNA-binding protein
VKYHEYRPRPILRDTVQCFWTHEATYSADTVLSITPDGCVELIFNFGSPYVLLTFTPPRTLPALIAVGLQKKAIPLQVSGTVKVVAARLFAWGAMALLQDELQAPGKMTPLGAGWDALAERLERHVERGRYEEAATILEGFLISRALLRTCDVRLVQAAAKLLYHTNGQCRIGELAECCHVSVRQLERRFHAAVGASPKHFARTLRFVQAQRRLMIEPDLDLTRLAYQSGYFDQAHFIKDFRDFAGKTPSDYARHMRHLQDFLRSKDVVFLQSSPPGDG